MSEAASDFNQSTLRADAEKGVAVPRLTFLVHGASGAAGDPADHGLGRSARLARPTGGRRPCGNSGQRARDVLPYSLSARLLMEFRLFRTIGEALGREAKKLGVSVVLGPG